MRKRVVRWDASPAISDESRVELGDADLDGIRIHFMKSGYPAANAILFVHGLNGDMSGWDYEVRRLGTKYFCIAFDMPGHGQSELPTGPLNADVVAKYASLLLDELGVSKCLVVGRSMGGLTAVHLSERDDRFLGVVLVSATLLSALEAFRKPFRSLLTNPSVLIATGLQILTAVLPGAERLLSRQAVRHKQLLRKFAVRPNSVSDAAVRYALTSHARPFTTAKAVKNAFFYDYAPHMLSLPRHVLVLSGAADQLIATSDLERFLRLVPQADVVLVNDSGHWLSSDAPNAVLNAVDDVAQRWF